MKPNTFFTRIFSLLALAGLLLAPVPVQAGTLAGTNIHVTTTADELNSDGDCSLREALRAANTDTAVSGCPAGSGEDVIYVPQGTYLLNLVGASEDLGLTGDLDITSSLSIIGAGPGVTILDGNATDRVIHVTGKFQVEIAALTIRNGYASETYGGGGIFNNQGSLKLTRVDLRNNVSLNTGGGLDNIGSGSAMLSKVTIAGNSARYGGGIYNGSNINIDSSTFSDNTSSQTGGGLDNGGFATLNNTTVSGNTSVEGGGIFSDGTITAYNTTFTLNNLAVFLGGGEMRFKNTIVANSTSGVNCQRRTGSPATFTSLGNNLESADTCDFLELVDLINTDPLLGALQDNGGDTYTHALIPTSPAIDSGDNRYCLPLDQRGFVRPADGDGDLVRSCDMGSFEYNAVEPFLVFLPTALRR